jgi:hypothetical protein
VIDGDPPAWLEQERARRDVVVIGSLGLVHQFTVVDAAGAASFTVLRRDRGEQR